MPRILVVDDDEVDREQVRRCLEPIEGLLMRVAGDGEEALASLAQTTPDLVLTDLRMPGMDGLQLVERIRDEHPAVPTLLMTSRGNERIAVQALQAGAAGYVPKSYLKQDLLETVRGLLQVAASRRREGAVLRYLDGTETRFTLDNDTGLISPVVAYLEGNLERLSFGSAPLRTQVGMALLEAISNGMVHGNLEVSSDLREGDADAFYDLIRRRRGQAPYAGRRLRCRARESSSRVEYVIRDEGPGFDPSSLPDPTAPEHAARVQGRGLFLIRTFMDAVTFNDRGNEITMVKSAGDSR